MNYMHSKKASERKPHLRVAQRWLEWMFCDGQDVCISVRVLVLAEYFHGMKKWEKSYRIFQLAKGKWQNIGLYTPLLVLKAPWKDQHGLSGIARTRLEINEVIVVDIFSTIPHFIPCKKLGIQQTCYFFLQTNWAFFRRTKLENILQFFVVYHPHTEEKRQR